MDSAMTDIESEKKKLTDQESGHDSEEEMNSQDSDDRQESVSDSQETDNESSLWDYCKDMAWAPQAMA